MQRENEQLGTKIDPTSRRVGLITVSLMGVCLVTLVYDLVVKKQYKGLMK